MLNNSSYGSNQKPSFENLINATTVYNKKSQKNGLDNIDDQSIFKIFDQQEKLLTNMKSDLDKNKFNVSEYERSKIQLNQLQSENNSLKEKISSQITESKSTNESDKQLLNSKIEAYERIIKEHEAREISYDNQISKLQTEISDKDKQFYDLQRKKDFKIEEVNKQTQVYLKDLRKLSDTVDFLNNFYLDIDKKYKQLIDKVFKLDEIVNSKDVKIKEFENQLSHIDIEYTVCNEEKYKVQQKLKKLEVEIQTMKTLACETDKITAAYKNDSNRFNELKQICQKFQNFLGSSVLTNYFESYQQDENGAIKNDTDDNERVIGLLQKVMELQQEIFSLKKDKSNLEVILKQKNVAKSQEKFDEDHRKRLTDTVNLITVDYWENLESMLKKFEETEATFHKMNNDYQNEINLLKFEHCDEIQKARDEAFMLREEIKGFEESLQKEKEKGMKDWANGILRSKSLPDHQMNNNQKKPSKIFLLKIYRYTPS